MRVRSAHGRANPPLRTLVAMEHSMSDVSGVDGIDE